MSTLLVAGLVLVSTAGALVARHSENRDEARARSDGWRTTAARLGAGFAQTSAVLASANALLDDDGSIDRDRLEVFSRVLLVPGGTASALAYEPIVRDADRARFEATSGVTITDRSADGSFVPAGRRDEYFPVMATEPANDSTRAVRGFDLAQDPARGDAARRARQTR